MIKIRYILFFILGVVIGILLKLQALNTITIGYEDYKLKQWYRNTDQSDLYVTQGMILNNLPAVQQDK